MSEIAQATPKLTPMMEQYRSIKKTLPEEAILFFRLGDFYEMFFEDALRASDILSITLTGREGGEAGRVPMCGIPYHAFHGYVRTLIEHNLKVAICEQIGDPKLTKGLVERKVTRIITPATFLDDETKNGSPQYMVAIAGQAMDACAISYLDLGTGEFYVKELGADTLLSELTLLSPREVICSKTLTENEKLVSFIKEILNAGLTTYEDWIFDAQEGARLLSESFKLASEKSLSFFSRKPCLAAAGAVLYYLRDHLHGAIGHLRLPVLLASGQYMILDKEAQRSLELVVSLSGRRDQATLLACIDQTMTSMGSRTLYHWLTHPLLSVDEIRSRQEAVAELTPSLTLPRKTGEGRVGELLSELRKLFKGVKDMERTLSRLNYGVANARDLVNLRLFLERVPEMLEILSQGKSSLIRKNAEAVRPFPQLQSLIASAIVKEPPLGLKDGGLIRDGYSAQLDELRSISHKGKSWILEFEKREIERTGIRSLKVKYSQVFGYTIEISNANRAAVPEDYTRKQTLASAERYIVPELKVWDEKISGAQDKIKLLEYQLFNEVREKILAELSPLQAMARAVGILDAMASLAAAALQKNWVRPEVTETDELIIQGGRHPVVEAMLAFGQFVENDTQLDRQENQLILLTGPNMAGKSTYIRQVAQIVLLAQIGSFIPAANARIGIVDRIFTRIGAADNLAQGESTFMVEMLETAHILQSATARSLLILDEVGRGTSTFDGVSIAWAICEHLAGGKVRPRTLFATHYHELTQLEDHFPGVKNYNILVRETRDGILFLRKVVHGGTDRSYGIHVAKLAGIPEAITRRAAEILHVLESENTEATQILEGRTKNKKEDKKSPQTTFFDLKTPEHPLIEEIKNLNIDQLTPLNALAKLADFKSRLDKEG